jgi:Na+/proline symporter
VYRRLIHQNASQRELVLVGRIMTGVVGALTLVAAFLMINVTGEKMFRTMVTLFSIATAPVAVPMLLGLVSKKVTTRAAVWGFIGGLSVGVALFCYFSYGLPRDARTTLFATSTWSVIWNPDGDEILFGSLPLKVEVLFLAVNALVTLTVMLVTSALFPMSAEQKERVEAFHKRITTPIGQLEEDRHVLDPSKMVFSPFRVVGICVAIIGLMLLGILPWVEGGMALGLGAVLGLGMVIVGALMAWKSRRFSA